MNLRCVLFCAAAALAPAAAGCSQERKWDLVPVKGIISLAGRPLSGLQVVFWADVRSGTQGPRATGVTDAQGRYELHTDAGDRGAVVGFYRVGVLDPSRLQRTNFANKLSKDQKDKLKRILPSEQAPEKYSKFETTPLRAEVKPGTGQTFDFDLPDVPPKNKRGG